MRNPPDFEILTLLCIYTLETVVLCINTRPTSGRDVHKYNTKCTNVLRLAQHHLQYFLRLLSQNSVRVVKKLPEDVKSTVAAPKFKASWRCFLVSGNLFSGQVFWILIECWYPNFVLFQFLVFVHPGFSVNVDFYLVYKINYMYLWWSIGKNYVLTSWLTS